MDETIGTDIIKAGVLINSLQMRGYDQFFMDLVIDKPFAEALMDGILRQLKEIMNVDIVNPVQTSVTGLEDTFALKEAYGDRLSFHGAIDVHGCCPTPVQQNLSRRLPGASMTSAEMAVTFSRPAIISAMTFPRKM
ncbi:MAG: hypothetical protein IIB77_03250 [Proteobacteria bacterium]|nr:hypothetical protein [Pseudomonadota bacterium]